MKTSILLLALTAALSAVCFGQPAAPEPESEPTVLFEATPERPYTITATNTARTSQVYVTNKAEHRMAFTMDFSNFENVDTTSPSGRVMQAEMRGRVRSEVNLEPGRPTRVRAFLVQEPSRPVAFDYAAEFVITKQQRAFDVRDDVDGKKAHPRPPESEWAKLPLWSDAATRGELEPFAWYRGSDGRPIQSLAFSTRTAEEVNASLGLTSPKELEQEVWDAMSRGESAAAVGMRQTQAMFRAWDRERLDMATVRVKDATGKVTERKATGAEQAELLRKYSGQLTPEQVAAETARANAASAQAR